MLLNTHPQAIYAFIAAHWQERGYAPTAREVAKGVSLSYNTTRSHLSELQSKGIVDWMPGKIRTLRITGSLDA